MAMRVVNKTEVNEFFENMMVFVENILNCTQDLNQVYTEMQEEPHMLGGIVSDIENCATVTQDIRSAALGAVQYIYDFSNTFNVKWEGDMNSVLKEIEGLSNSYESYNIFPKVNQTEVILDSQKLPSSDVKEDLNDISLIDRVNIKDPIKITEDGEEKSLEGYSIYTTALGKEDTINSLLKKYYDDDNRAERIQAQNFVVNANGSDIISNNTEIPVIGVLKYDTKYGSNLKTISETVGISEKDLVSYNENVGNKLNITNMVDNDGNIISQNVSGEILIPTYNSNKENILAVASNVIANQSEKLETAGE